MTTNPQQYRASTFKVEKSPAAWAKALGSLPNAHPLQSRTLGSVQGALGLGRYSLPAHYRRKQLESTGGSVGSQA
ncbi:MAG: hypothetical protein M5U34_13125 [Chloroflexi bacterium]|nr:hypothetical protein [Chloroflexota bacterium]